MEASNEVSSSPRLPSAFSYGQDRKNKLGGGKMCSQLHNFEHVLGVAGLYLLVPRQPHIKSRQRKMSPGMQPIVSLHIRDRLISIRDTQSVRKNILGCAVRLT